jgi:hypothetical protein
MRRLFLLQLATVAYRLKIRNKSTEVHVTPQSTEHCIALIFQFVSTVSVLLCARTSLSVILLSKQRNILNPALSFSFPGKCAFAFTSAYDSTANK